MSRRSNERLCYQGVHNIDLNQWGQDRFSEARQILMPHGLPLVAELIPKRYLLGSNLWIPFGPKRGCNVYPRADNEWDNLVLLEGDPDVLYYCENYPAACRRIDGKNRKTVFDAFALYRNGSVLLVEVKDDNTTVPPEGSREYWQLRTQEVYTNVYDIPYERRDIVFFNQHRLQINNWKAILADLTTWNGRNLRHEEYLVAQFLRSYAEYGCPLRTIMHAIGGDSKDAIRVATYRLLHKGDIAAPLNEVSYQEAYYRIRHG